MHIRPCEKDDVPHVVDLYRRCFAEPPWHEDFDPKELRNEFFEILSWPDSVFFIAIEDEKVVGGAFGFALKRKKEIHDLVPDSHKDGFYFADLFVSSQKRNRGIGKQLTSRRLSVAKQNGHTTGIVRTSVNQPIIQHLYVDCMRYRIVCTQETVSKKNIGGEIRDVPDTRVIMIGALES